MTKSREPIIKKALIVTTVASTIDQFCMNDIDILQKTHEVHVAANFNSNRNNTSPERVRQFKRELGAQNIMVHEIPFARSPISLNNIIGYNIIKKIMEKYNFDIVHCHTPIASVLTRIAARKMRKINTKIIYTAHGFHFYKGASLKEWVLYYPIERWLSRYTDKLITINKEDYIIAKKFKAKQTTLLPGIGVKLNDFNDLKVDKNNKRLALGLDVNSLVLLSVGELNKNKNHEIVIRALARMNNPNIKYIICGQGDLQEYLISLIEDLNLGGQVKLLGYRNDIAEICKISDIFVFPSFREGLSVALMEAMASNLLVICSNIRGNSDLIEDDKGGYLINPYNVKEVETAIIKMMDDKNKNKMFREYNGLKIKKYSSENVKRLMENIYKEV